ncbi:MAG: 50S ribosomal protein L11 methyltransferase [Defluviitaleaceae bacterium]|nr:50S ribosomal protein L11 methyltransferase [Defluviitaleaceae bacterium]
MEWIEVRVTCKNICTELIYSILYDFGISGVQLIDDNETALFLSENPLHWDYVDENLIKSLSGASAVTIIFYLANNPDGISVFKQIKTALASEQLYEEIFSDIKDDETWLNEWKKYYVPFKCGKKVVVKPYWENYEPVLGDIVFTIDPGSVFGTGLHVTTQLCVEALEKFIRPGDSVFDIGSGSGILMLVSILLGAGFAAGCDFDPAANDSVCTNAKLNGIDASMYRFFYGNPFADENLLCNISQKKFDKVVCNIASDAVLTAFKHVKKIMGENCIFIASGIIDERLGEILSAAHEHGFKAIEKFGRDGWHMVAFINNN